jgi:NAD-dependent dihydropyrimidine dehydrogenase PreA subunit/DNA-binding Lrp family transcriptional regulator
MTDDIYRRLARHLDKLPGGFPATESGVELRLLRRLFTPDQAELAPYLTLIPEEPRVVARRARLGTEETNRRLEEMAKEGLIFRIEPREENRPFLYMASQFVIGIWEYHVNDLDPEFIKDMNEYIPALVEEAWKVPQLRTIPVSRTISVQNEVLPYEEAETLIRAQRKLLVAPCICRREHTIAGHGCDKPEETCLVFGYGADYYERNGLGRIIDQQEALDILEKANEAGLVLQPSNTQKITNICCCCGCCCQVLKSLKRREKPLSMTNSPFIVSTNPDTCSGCETCVDRCQMDALLVENEHVVLNADRCIGCGLCVSTCPTDSLTLIRKPESEQLTVPKNMQNAAIQLGKARGKMGTGNLVSMLLKSKKDRLLASK